MIILKRLSVWIALAGVSFAGWVLMGANKIEPMPTPVSEPPRSPYEQTVAASGIIESVNENVRIAPPVAGLITGLGSQVLNQSLLGQDFVLFRDQHGRYGLLDRDCPHRGADLAYGRLEDGGLRCLFHGWLFDVDGKCLETPAEPEGSVLCQRVRQRSYPVVVKNGRYGAYATHDGVNATLPSDKTPESITLEEAVALIE